jgi:diguanylate cyclase (GGDEF)-like protein
VKRIWTWYVCFLAGSILAYLVLPNNEVLTSLWQVGVGYVSAAAIMLGASRQPAGARLPWWLFALGVFSNASGLGVDQFLVTYLGHDGMPPTLGDAFYLPLYPALASGLALLIHRRQGRRDWAAMVDSTAMTTGLGLLAWVFVIQPAVGDATVPLVSRGTIVAYPVGDIVLLAMTVRLMRSDGARGAAFWCMGGSLLAFLAADTGWAIETQLNVELSTGSVRLLSAVTLSAFGLFGAAGLHPAARSIAMPGAPQPPRLSPLLLSLLAVASLVAPALLIFQAARGDVTDGLAIAVGATCLFLLVLTRMAQLLNQVERQAREVRELARHDELTGLPNRRAWNDELPRALERSRRDRSPACIAMIDLDHFKRFNDTYGHPAGDQLLKAASATWHERLRSVDLLARYGGEEFIVLLPNTSLGNGCGLLAELSRVTPLGQTFSAGVAEWDGTETSGALIARADAALYQAKAAGRNRVLPANAASQVR